MRDIAFFAGSLAVVGLSVAAAPYALGWRLLAGALLLLVWGYGLARAAGGRLRPLSPVRLLPGHALLFLALGLAGSDAGRWAWLAVPPLTVLLDLAHGRSLAPALYAILWLDLFALLHQVVALGRDLGGLALVAWSGAMAALALLFVGSGVRRLRRKGVVP